MACVKRESKNLATLNSTLSIVVSCDVFQLEKPFCGTCFRHVLWKVCHYATNEKKVHQGMKEVSLKDAQSTLQKTITWTKKVKQKEARMGSCLLKSKFASKKVENLYGNQVCFKSCTFLRDIGLCLHHHDLL